VEHAYEIILVLLNAEVAQEKGITSESGKPKRGKAVKAKSNDPSSSDAADSKVDSSAADDDELSDEDDDVKQDPSTALNNTGVPQGNPTLKRQDSLHLQLLRLLYGFPATVQVVTAGVLESPSSALRQAASDGIRKLCNQFKRQLHLYVSALSSNAAGAALPTLPGGKASGAASGVTARVDITQHFPPKAGAGTAAPKDNSSTAQPIPAPSSASSAGSPRVFFVNTLLAQLPRLADPLLAARCGEYFQLLRDLFSMGLRQGSSSTTGAADASAAPVVELEP